jgi:hypothetical protein
MIKAIRNKKLAKGSREFFMRMKRIVGMVTLLVFTLLISGCFSTPEIKRVKYLGGQKYDVVIDKDYMEKPEELKYAINNFVKEQGGTSYDIEKTGSNDFLITVPGKTPVEDLPPMKHFHVGKTVTAILLPSVGVGVLTWLLIMVNAENNNNRHLY